MRSGIVLSLVGAFLPALAAAAPFSPPAGCTAYLTVQSRSCMVSHHFTCKDDPEGWQRRVDLDEEGMVYFGAIDTETQWVESYHMLSSHSERLEESPIDRASFSTLLAKGVDSWDFRTLSDEAGTTRYVGQDRLTGEHEEIGGVTLEQTQFAMTAYDEDGAEIWRSHGREYISRDWRMFLSGFSTVTVGEESWESDDSPAAFVFPGEPGFLSSTPVHGCGVVMSSAPLTR